MSSAAVGCNLRGERAIRAKGASTKQEIEEEAKARLYVYMINFNF